MKASMLGLAVLIAVSCKSKGFVGGISKKEIVSTAREEPVEAPDLPIEESTVEIGRPAGKRSFTLTTSRLKHDSLYKNCLSILIEGKVITVGCNKDFASLPSKTIELSANLCLPILASMESFKPVDTQDCIKKIQANRQQHFCDYQVSAFSKADWNGEKFKTQALLDQEGRIRSLQAGFEDGADGDFNDYVFDLVAGGTGFFRKVGTDFEYCTE